MPNPLLTLLPTPWHTPWQQRQVLKINPVRYGLNCHCQGVNANHYIQVSFIYVRLGGMCYTQRFLTLFGFFGEFFCFSEKVVIFAL